MLFVCVLSGLAGKTQRFCAWIPWHGHESKSMVLREFLYPSLELRLVLARALDVDMVVAAQGTLSKVYQKMAARLTLSKLDAQRLGLKEGEAIEVKSKNGKIVVRACLSEKTPEGLAVMPPSAWANALLSNAPPYQGIPISIKPTKKPITRVEKLP